MSDEIGLSLVPTYKWQAIFLNVPVNDNIRRNISDQICQIGRNLFNDNFKYHLYQKEFVVPEH